MKIYKEIRLRDFEFWAGAKTTVKYLSERELDMIEEVLVDCECEGDTWSETEINDLFWFDDDWIANILDYSSFEELMNKRKYKFEEE